MFSITHDKNFVYSVITVSELTQPITKGNTLQELMYVWANMTAIPFIEHLARFKTDDVVWYLK